MATYIVTQKIGNAFYPIDGAEYFQQGAADATARRCANQGTIVRVLIVKGNNETEICYELTGK